MGIFSRNPMEDGWSTKRKICFVCFAAFYLLSAWVTSESLFRSLPVSPVGTGVPARIFYLILALLFLGFASFCLSVFQEAFQRGPEEHRLIKLVAGGSMFLIVWFAILMANSHGLYYAMAVDEQRMGELRDIRTQLQLIKSNSESAFSAAKVKFENEIEGDIKNMKDEINNPFNPGRAVETNKIVNRIAEKLGQEIDMPSNAPTSANGSAQYADGLARKVREITQKKLEIISQKIKDLEIFLNQEEYQATIKRLDDLIGNYPIKNEHEVSLGLRNSYSTYNKVQEYIGSLFKEPLISKYTELPAKPLPSLPVSIQSESISYVWGEYLGGGALNIVKFRWAVFLGFIFDLGCYAFWYFGVLPKRD